MAERCGLFYQTNKLLGKMWGQVKTISGQSAAPRTSQGPSAVGIFIKNNIMVSDMLGQVRLKRFLGRALRPFYQITKLLAEMWGQVGLRQFLDRMLRLGQARGPSAAAIFIKNNTMISDMWAVGLSQVKTISLPSAAARTGSGAEHCGLKLINKQTICWFRFG